METALKSGEINKLRRLKMNTPSKIRIKETPDLASPTDGSSSAPAQRAEST